MTAVVTFQTYLLFELNNNESNPLIFDYEISIRNIILD